MFAGYSDSDSSDNEGRAPPPKPTSKPAPSSKSGFTKLVDRANPSKIKVNLPGSTPNIKDGQDDADSEARPAKRARTEASGFNAMLPAPKRTGAIKNVATGGSGTAVKRALGKPLGVGINLKTGAQPAFSRERAAPEPELFNDMGEDVDVENVPTTGSHPNGHVQDLKSLEDKSTSTPENQAQRVTKVGNAMAFKPLSVINAQKKKKKAKARPSTSTPATQSPSASTLSAKPALKEEKIDPAPPKPKVSLFSMTSESTSHTPSSSSYEPLLHTRQIQSEDDEAQPGLPDHKTFSETERTSATQGSTGTSLQDIASDLSLSASARRQLFGRNGVTDTSAINIANFNMDAQYAENEALRAAGETVQHAPVRGIAGGKHSLKQLVANANNQSEALEEQFASGRRNRKEAGSKYGW